MFKYEKCECKRCHVCISNYIVTKITQKHLTTNTSMQNSNDPDDELDFSSFSLTAEELDELRKIFEGNTDETNTSKNSIKTENETPPPVPTKKEKKYRYKPDECNFHSWEKTGSGPVSNEPWFNCVYCGIAKEKVHKF